MKIRESFKYGKRIFLQKSSVSILLVLAMAVYWLLSGISGGISLYTSISRPVELGLTGSKELSGEGLPRLLYLSLYEEMQTVLSYKDYSAPVIVAGCCDDYLKFYFSQDMPGGAMPYVFLDVSVYDELENESQEPFSESLDTLIMENIRIGQKEARVLDVVDKGEETAYVYTDLESYQRLEETVLSPSQDASASGNSQAANRIGSNGEAGYGGDGNPIYYVAGLENAFRLEENVNYFMSEGFQVQIRSWGSGQGAQPQEGQAQDLSSVMDAINHNTDNVIQYMIQGIILFLCAITLTCFQNQLFLKDHKEFFAFIQRLDTSGKSRKQIWRWGRFLIWISGMAAGALIFVLF